MGGYIRKNSDFLDIQGKSNFKVDFRVPEVSQRLDIETTLQMAFGKTRGDFSRPQSGTGIIVYIALIFYISQTLDPKPSFQENLTFKDILISRRRSLVNFKNRYRYSNSNLLHTIPGLPRRSGKCKRGAPVARRMAFSITCYMHRHCSHLANSGYRCLW